MATRPAPYSPPFAGALQRGTAAAGGTGPGVHCRLTGAWDHKLDNGLAGLASYGRRSRIVNAP